MTLDEMNPKDAAAKIAGLIDKSRWRSYGWDETNTLDGAIATVTESFEKMIDFGRNARVISVEIRVNRGSAGYCVGSTKYHGVYVHQIITISDGKRKYEARHPDHIISTNSGESALVGHANLFGFNPYGHMVYPGEVGVQIIEAIPQLRALRDQTVEIRRQLTNDVVEEAAEQYVNKNQKKAKAQIIKKLGNFLMECNLRDEDPKFLLQVMKFVSRDNFWEMKNFFNYCRRNMADVHFLTEEEIVQAQNFAVVSIIQKS